MLSKLECALVRERFRQFLVESLQSNEAAVISTKAEILGTVERKPGAGAVLSTLTCQLSFNADGKIKGFESSDLLKD